jgi:hypothetical protein
VRFTRPLAALVLCALTFSVAACGEDKAAKEAQARKEARQRQAAKDRAAKVKARKEAQAKLSACEAELDPLVSALSELGSRLDVGLNYEEYTDQVGDLKVAYDQVDWKDQTDLDCVQGVGLPAEKALNQYTRALNTWTRCFDDIDCDNDSITPSLRKRWATASRRTDDAKEGLQALRDAVSHAS